MNGRTSRSIGDIARRAADPDMRWVYPKRDGVTDLSFAIGFPRSTMQHWDDADPDAWRTCTAHDHSEERRIAREATS